MTTRITQFNDTERTIFKVEGPLLLEDAIELGNTCKALRQQSEHEIAIDLLDVTFLSSSSAIVLCFLQYQMKVTLQGATFFVQKVLELAAKSFAHK